VNAEERDEDKWDVLVLGEAVPPQRGLEFIYDETQNPCNMKHRSPKSARRAHWRAAAAHNAAPFLLSSRIRICSFGFLAGTGVNGLVLGGYTS